MGDAKLMPLASECPRLVVTAKNGYICTNSSWVIRRLIGGYEAWMDPAVQGRLEQMLDERVQYMRRHTRLSTTVARPS